MSASAPCSVSGCHGCFGYQQQQPPEEQAMSAIFKPTRTLNPEPDHVFFAMPFGIKELANGQPFDFDAFYTDVCVPVVRECGMTPVRVDGLYGAQGVLEAVWRAMQQAGVVIADFTGGSPNVAFEMAWALMLNKRTVVITQESNDIPSDIRGLYRYISYSQNYQDMQMLRKELALQLTALRQEPADEMAPMPMPGGSTTSVKAKVINADKDYVMVRDDSGRYGVMGSADVDVSRLVTDMRRMFPAGTVLDGAFVIDPMRKEMRYTLVSGERSPWPLLGNKYKPGTVLKSRVINVDERHGAFVHVEYGINGLVPSQQFGGTLPEVGAEIETMIVTVDEHRRRIALRLMSVGTGQQPAASKETPRAALNWRGHAEVTRVVPEDNGRGGYLLLRLPTTRRNALLLVKDMSDDLRADLGNNEVELGEEIYVEVYRMNKETGKTLLRELPEPDEAPSAA